ncbi:ferritin [Bernardetia sp.]|uniref:ferritin n=1 Tax=Bernardetia sp. TaxID=1937974 RepID=UPI0025B8B46F|nr:ferritin [Bernardetia sp.]
MSKNGVQKTVVTMKTSITQEMQNLINKQIQLEARSSWAYLAAASWCDKEGYVNSAKYLYNHAEEERMHMMKFFDYLNNAGGHALAPEITDLRYNFDKLREVFETALKHEIKVTLAINDLVDACLKAKDFATFQFLQWFVNEQREEEVISRRAVELFDIIGEEGQGIWLIDQAIGNLENEIAQIESPSGEAE